MRKKCNAKKHQGGESASPKATGDTGSNNMKLDIKNNLLGVENANIKIKTARDKFICDLDNQLDILNKKEKELNDRLEDLEDKKAKTAEENGDIIGAQDDDLVEINAGGKIIAAKRSTLTQFKGTRLEALFSGRWDKKLNRDNNGRIFLDVNPTCFQAIVDYLNEWTISTEGNPPDPPSVDNEIDGILLRHLELFGLIDTVFPVELPDSKIITRIDRNNLLHELLKEDRLDGNFTLLYRSSRDGQDGSAFHAKCDAKGPTLTVIETTDGAVLGGYTETSWTTQLQYDSYCGSNHYYSESNRAFLFVLPRNGTGLTKMEMKIAANNGGNYRSNIRGIYGNSSCGPSFGGYSSGIDLTVNGSSVSLNFGRAYEAGNSGMRGNYTIKEMEVFQVHGVTPTQPVKVSRTQEPQKPTEVGGFTEDVNKAINGKWTSLHDFESDLIKLEEAYKDEGNFISTFAKGKPEDVIALNVSGSVMMIARRTLVRCNEPSLASKIADTEQANTDTKYKAIEEWTHEDVVARMNQLKGVTEFVVSIFEENEISGHELVEATIYVLLNEIKKLEKAGGNPEILIEHSPYCFEKIIDSLRLQWAYEKGLVETKPDRPVVRDSEKARFEKVVKHYFPGDSSKFILG